MIDTVLHAATALLIFILGAYVTRIQKARDQFADSIAEQFRELAKATTVAKDTAHSLELRMVKVELKSHNMANDFEQFRDALNDIRDNMIRRDDLVAVNQRIDDALCMPRNLRPRKT